MTNIRKKTERFTSFISYSINRYFMTICFILFVILLMSITFIQSIRVENLKTELTSSQDEYEELAEEYANLYKLGTDVYQEYTTINTEYTEAKLTYNAYYAQLDEIMSSLEEVDAENQALKEENAQMKEDLSKYEERAELFNKYEYAIYNDAGQRTDFTYEQIKTAEEIMTEKGLDANLLFSIAMTESNGDAEAANPKSSSRGYGQFLSGTAKFVYEDLMNAGYYTHDMAYNGNTSIELMANYLSYLKQNNSNIYAIINDYRGIDNDTKYLAKIDSFLREGGVSLETVNSKIYN